MQQSIANTVHRCHRHACVAMRYHAEACSHEREHRTCITPMDKSGPGPELLTGKGLLDER